MRFGLSRGDPAARAAVNALAVLALTSIHHAYGAVVQPPPRYELPGGALFETTGILQRPSAHARGGALYRMPRARRAAASHQRSGQGAMAHMEREYVPAAGKHWRLPFYDLLAKLLGADSARRVLLGQVALRPGQRVLDIGCGTGTLAVEIKRRHPEADVAGLDPDPGALAIARRKAARAGAGIAFEQGFADALPYPDASFNHVTSSFMFHHLPRDAREPTLREVRRVLKPGGRLHLLDFDGPSVAHGGFIARKIHGSGHMRDNAQARVLEHLRAAGLEDARVVAMRDTWAASMACYQARRGGGA